MTGNESGPASVAAQNGAGCSSAHDHTTNQPAWIPTGTTTVTQSRPDAHVQFRDPLVPQIGVLLLGDAHDGLLLRWAQKVPFGKPLRVSFAVVRAGVVVSAVEYPVVDLAAALIRDPSLFRVRVQSEARLHGLCDAAVRAALGLLLLASDRTINIAGSIPRFSLARPGNPCPICEANGAHIGKSRACMMSDRGIVVCRGAPSSKIVATGRRPIADVVGCKFPGNLWVVSEPAASKLVVLASEAGA